MLRVGDWDVHRDTSEIHRDGTVVSLAPREMEVLVYLAERAGRAVSTDELLNALWPNPYSGDQAVHKALSLLRQALGDDPKHPAYIRTVKKRGYVLVATVADGSGQAGAVDSTASRGWLWATVAGVVLVGAVATGWRVFGPSTAEPLTIAVLPWRDLSARGDLGGLVDGIADDIRDGLTRMPGYATVPRIQSREDALPEGVSLVLDGYLQREGEGVVGVARLNDVFLGRTLWSEPFARDSGDPQELKDHIASRVLVYLEARLRTAPLGPRDPEAREAYNRWLHHGFQGDPDEGSRWLERAVALDPEWAMGQVLLAIDLFADVPFNPAAAEPAYAALGRARTLGLGDDPLWITTDALFALILEGDFDRAERRLRSVMPGFPLAAMNYAQMMLASRLIEESQRFFELETRLNPLHAQAWSDLAVTRALRGDLDGAYEAMQRVGALTPFETFNGVHAPLTWILPNSGHIDEARALAARCGELGAESPGRLGTLLMFKSFFELEIARAVGDWQAVRAFAENSEQTGQWFSAWMYYRELDDARAEAMLDRYLAAPVRSRMFSYIVDLSLGPRLRDHPDVRRIRDHLGFTRAWRLELCRRAATLPMETGLGCEPSSYEESVVAMR